MFAAQALGQLGRTDDETRILLGLAHDEGPIYQMHRLARYKEIAEQLIVEGKAYWCYCTPGELEEMKSAQEARGEKRRYDGRWRDSTATPPAGVTPVIRFKTPLTGEVTMTRVSW